MTMLLLDVLPWQLSGDDRAQRLYLLALCLLGVGTLAALLALRFPRIDVLAAALACGGMASWLLSTDAGEGRTLVEVLPGNGVTQADLAAAPAAVLVAALCWRRLRRPS